MKKAEVEQALERHDRLCSNYRYLPFGDAGGPDPCTHGYARGIPCPRCDAAAFATDVPALCRGWLEKEAEIERLSNAILSAHHRALPANWVYSGPAETLDLLVGEITTLRWEKERLKAALAEAPHARDCQSGPGYCLKCKGRADICYYDYESCRDRIPGACNCWKSRITALSAASDSQPTAEAPHSYLCAASTEGNPIKIGPCDCRSASDSQPREKQ